jgi:hypothetical protein
VCLNDLLNHNNLIFQGAGIRYKIYLVSQELVCDSISHSIRRPLWNSMSRKEYVQELLRLLHTNSPHEPLTKPKPLDCSGHILSAQHWALYSLTHCRSIDSSRNSKSCWGVTVTPTLVTVTGTELEHYMKRSTSHQAHSKSQRLIPESGRKRKRESGFQYDRRFFKNTSPAVVPNTWFRRATAPAAMPIYASH